MALATFVVLRASLSQTALSSMPAIRERVLISETANCLFVPLCAVLRSERSILFKAPARCGVRGKHVAVTENREANYGANPFVSMSLIGSCKAFQIGHVISYRTAEGDHFIRYGLRCIAFLFGRV